MCSFMERQNECACIIFSKKRFILVMWYFFLDFSGGGDGGSYNERTF